MMRSSLKLVVFFFQRGKLEGGGTGQRRSGVKVRAGQAAEEFQIALKQEASDICEWTCDHS